MGLLYLKCAFGTRMLAPHGFKQSLLISPSAAATSELLLE